MLTKRVIGAKELNRHIGHGHFNNILHDNLKHQKSLWQY